ncbi:PaaI family thioesterase [Halobacteriales archaeon Cl-PHB]
MDLAALFNDIPYHQLLGIEIVEAADGHAEGRLPSDDDLLSNPYGEVMHGGATYALADAVAGAAVISLAGDVSPTVDMRMDYLAPATTDLVCEAEVIRHGSHLAMVRAEVDDADGTHVATAHGTYKTGGQGKETPWGEETELPDEE